MRKLLFYIPQVQTSYIDENGLTTVTSMKISIFEAENNGPKILRVFEIPEQDYLERDNILLGLLKSKNQAHIDIEFDTLLKNIDSLEDLKDKIVLVSFDVLIPTA